MKLKRSKCLLVSFVLGALYAVYLVSYFFGIITDSTETAEAIGSSIATFLVTPHIILVILAVIFNGLGYFGNRRGFALTGGILYSVAAAAFLLYAPFVLIQLILSFVGFSNLKKINIYNSTLTVTQQ